MRPSCAWSCGESKSKSFARTGSAKVCAALGCAWAIQHQHAAAVQGAARAAGRRAACVSGPRLGHSRFCGTPRRTRDGDPRSANGAYRTCCVTRMMETNYINCSTEPRPVSAFAARVCRGVLWHDDHRDSCAGSFRLRARSAPLHYITCPARAAPRVTCPAPDHGRTCRRRWAPISACSPHQLRERPQA